MGERCGGGMGGGTGQREITEGPRSRFSGSTHFTSLVDVAETFEPTRPVIYVTDKVVHM